MSGLVNNTSSTHPTRALNCTLPCFNIVHISSWKFLSGCFCCWNTKTFVGGWVKIYYDKIYFLNFPSAHCVGLNLWGEDIQYKISPSTQCEGLLGQNYRAGLSRVIPDHAQDWPWPFPPRPAEKFADRWWWFFLDYNDCEDNHYFDDFGLNGDGDHDLLWWG